jgi:hypothetical protein
MSVLADRTMPTRVAAGGHLDLRERIAREVALGRHVLRAQELADRFDMDETHIHTALVQLVREGHVWEQYELVDPHDGRMISVYREWEDIPFGSVTSAFKIGEEHVRSVFTPTPEYEQHAYARYGPITRRELRRQQTWLAALTVVLVALAVALVITSTNDDDSDGRDPGARVVDNVLRDRIDALESRNRLLATKRSQRSMTKRINSLNSAVQEAQESADAASVKAGEAKSESSKARKEVGKLDNLNDRVDDVEKVLPDDLPTLFP